MEPILLDVPMPIVTDRLVIREPRVGEGRIVNEAVAESFKELNVWMPWAKTMPTAEESESFTRECVAKFVTRKDFSLRIWSRDQTRLLGSTGLHVQSWSPRKFEIGYWLRTSESGKGLMTEAVRVLADYAFRQFDAVRVYIRADRENLASRRVAEKAGFELEGILRNDYLSNDGTLRDMCFYAKIPCRDNFEEVAPGGRSSC